MTEMSSGRIGLVAGIDVSATRGLDAAILTPDGTLVQTAWLPGLDGLRIWLDAWASRLSAVAVDAPSSIARVAGGRQAERVLRARGVSLYLAPPSEVGAASWMVEGWAVFRLLAEHGFPEARDDFERMPGDRAALECFPYAAYVAWSGAKRPPETVPTAWVRRVLARRGYVLPGTAKDAPDAVAAALTALAWVRGEAVAYGDPDEGVIWTPCALPDLTARPGQRPGRASSRQPQPPT
jgi:predicted nuclease with RNAse H fold